ncbi:MAG TPA: hypothetical protein VF280_17545 [Burkholderiales bacterium]
MKNLVAKMTVVGVRPDGARLTLTVEIGRPYEERGAWACAIEIAPLKSKLEDVRGADSFHAVWLACALVLQLLGNLQAEGWRLENPDGSEFPLESYKSGLASG